MTTSPFVEGNASEYYLVEDSAGSEDYDSEDYSDLTEASPDSNLVESAYYDVLPDVLIDEYVPAYAAPAPAVEAENAIEQSVVGESVEADATFKSGIEVEEEEDTLSEWSDQCSEETWVESEDDNMTCERSEEIWVESDDEDVTSECSEETWVKSEDEDVTSECSEETSVESDDEDVTTEVSDDVSEDEAWVAGEEGLTIQDSAKAYSPFAEETWLAYSPFEEETWVAGEGAMLEVDSVDAAFEVETWVAGEEGLTIGFEDSAEAITSMITIPAAPSTSLIPMWSTQFAVIESTGDSTVPTPEWEAFFACSPMVILQKFGTAILTAVEILERFRIHFRRFINSVLGKWEASAVE